MATRPKLTLAREKPQTHDALQLDRADSFVRRERLAHRIAVVIMVVVVLAAIAGVFGQGPLSHQSISSGGLTVKYERFSRVLLRNPIAIEARAAGAEPTVRISLDKAFLDDLEIAETRPAHVRMDVLSDRVDFLVPVTEGLARLELHVKAERPGLLTSSIRLAGAASESVQIRQFVFF